MCTKLEWRIVFQKNQQTLAKHLVYSNIKVLDHDRAAIAIQPEQNKAIFECMELEAVLYHVTIT